MVADLGGASLRPTRRRAGRILASASLPLGAVRITRRFPRHDPPTPRDLRALRHAVHEALLNGLPSAWGEAMVGSGGTARTLASMHLAGRRGRRRSRQGLRLRPSDLTATRERLEALPARQRRRLPGLKAERADVILAGAIAIEDVMMFGGDPMLIVRTRGVRDGLPLRKTFDGGVGP